VKGEGREGSSVLSCCPLIPTSDKGVSFMLQKIQNVELDLKKSSEEGRKEKKFAQKAGREMI